MQSRDIRLKFLAVFLVVTTSSVFASAFTLPLPSQWPHENLSTDLSSPWLGMKSGPQFVDPATREDLLGMGSLSCSGALVDLGRSASARAVLLTNGHCAKSGFIAPGKFVSGIDYTRSSISIGTRNGMTRVTPTQVLYGTMSGTDIALIELAETYAELTAEGAKVFKISSQNPQPGTVVAVISGYWRERQDCNVERIVGRMEEGNWSWANSIALSETCHVRGGYSGSPILNTQTQEIVAALNTTNEDGEMCSVNNPCEVGADGAKVIHQGKAYGQQVSEIHTCISNQGNVDLTLAGCKLLH